MIKVTAELYPFGQGPPRGLFQMQIESNEAGSEHKYYVAIAHEMMFGHIPKDKSAHQNILHVLRDVLNDMDLDRLGEDYIPRGGWPEVEHEKADTP